MDGGSEDEDWVEESVLWFEWKKKGGMQHLRGNTSKTVLSVRILLLEKNWQDCNSLRERCKCVVFHVGTLTGRIGATISCRWRLWFAGWGVFEQVKRQHGWGRFRWATALVTGWCGSGGVVIRKGWCRCMWCLWPKRLLWKQTQVASSMALPYKYVSRNGWKETCMCVTI